MTWLTLIALWLGSNTLFFWWMAAGRYRKASPLRQLPHKQ